MRVRILAGMVGFALLISGCAVGKSQKKEVDVLRNRVSQLESEIELRERRQRELEAELVQQQELNQSLQAKAQVKQESQPASQSSKPAPGPLSATAIRQIQTALVHAGFNAGTIDGKMGAKTKEAVKAFQRTNGLKPDGVVGNKTWSLLAAYLPRESKGSQK